MPVNTIDNEKQYEDFVLVLIHGAGCCAKDWPVSWLNGDAFGTNRIYAIDLPGHGDEKDKSGCNSIEKYCDHVDALLTQNNLTNVILVGHSMGAAIALEMANRGNAKISGLCLIAGASKFGVSSAILTGIEQDFANTVDMIVKYSWARGSDENLKNNARQQMIQTGGSTLHGDFLACSLVNLNEKLSVINVPILALSARDDRMVPVKTMEEMVAALPNATLEIIDNCGHFLHFEQTALCTIAINSYLKKTSRIMR